MVRAQYKGIIEYSEYKRYDINWRRREALLLNELDNELVIADRRDLLSAYNALYSGSEESFEAQSNYHDSIFNQLKSIRAINLPWIKTAEESEKETITAAKKQWNDFEQFKTTDAFARRNEHSKSIFGKIAENSETDKKLKEMRAASSKKPERTRKIIDRVEFNG